MKRCGSRVVRMLLSLLLAVAAPPGAAATAGPMLLETVAGHVFQRTAYDETGSVTETSRLEVGSLRYDDDGAVLATVLMYGISDSGEWVPTARLEWSCEPEAAGMLTDVLVMTGEELRDGLRFTVRGSLVRYPGTLRPDLDLDDIVLTVRMKKGFLTFIGTRMRLRFRDRRVSGRDALIAGSYTLESDIEARMSVLRIPVRRRHLRSIEVVHPELGLLRQRVVYPGGGYMVIERLDLGDERN